MSPRATYMLAIAINLAVALAWLLLSHHLLGSWTSLLTYGAGIAICGLVQWRINEAFCCPGCGAWMAYWYVGDWKVQMPWPAAKCGKCGEPLDKA